MAKTETYEDEAVRLHAFYKGKIQVVPKCPIQNRRDFSIWYTPGVAASCRAIEKNPEAVYEQTNRANSIAIISDGSRVLGLGNIGPQAGLPVMEGKALLFKYLGGVDAIPICLDTQNEEEIIRTVELIQPSFGGINLEDISQPKCFRILDRLHETLSIPVWHDDQQGSATALLAGLLNALKVTNRNPESVRIAMIGMGAANVASYRLLKAAGFKPELIIACDSKGTLHRGRHDIEDQQHHFKDKWRVCCETNPRAVTGGIKEALRSADVCIAFSQPGPGVIRPEWVQGMAPHAIVFACANPVPEIWPDEARKAGAAIVATGRGDFPNQLNNSLVFPAMFRGVLDIRARTISNGMCIAAARELAQYADEQGIHPENILPQMDDCSVIARVAAAAAAQAQLEGLARIRKTREEIYTSALRTVVEMQRVMSVLMEHDIVQPRPRLEEQQ